MSRHVLVRVALPVALLASCGGSKKTVSQPTDTSASAKPAAPPPETEEDREKKRHAAAIAIVPEGSTCLPVSLKDDGAPRLELSANGSDAIVCAFDTDKSRLLGAVACWKVDLSSGALAYTDAAAMPGRNLDVLLDDRCARGYCIPKEAKLDGVKVAHMAWNLDKSKVAVLAGENVHVFDAASKNHEATFSVRGDKGVTNDPIAVFWVGDSIFVEGADQGPYSAMWQFKSDGTPTGPLVGIGKDDKPLSTYHGSFWVLDKNHVAVAEKGMSTVTTYEVDSGKRTKAVRKIGKISCKPEEQDAYWHDGDKVSDKCKGSMTSQFGTMIGASAVMGAKNLLVMLRDDRLGELAVVDPKGLTEKKVIKMQWCTDSNGGAAPKGDDKPDKADKADKADAAPKDSAKKEKATRGPQKKAKTGGDPDEGGE